MKMHYGKSRQFGANNARAGEDEPGAFFFCIRAEPRPAGAASQNSNLFFLFYSSLKAARLTDKGKIILKEWMLLPPV